MTEDRITEELTTELKEELTQTPEEKANELRSNKEKQRKKEILEWVKDIAISLIIVAIILTFIKPIIIKQESMQNTFFANDYVFVSKQAYTLFGDMERGDVIVFKSDLIAANGSSKFLIKRIIGLPGDTLEIIDGFVYLNGEKQDEPYVKEPGLSGEMAEIKIPGGCLFVMGDNRAVSQDSRSEAVGFVSQDDVMGKVVLRVFPFNKIATF